MRDKKLKRLTLFFGVTVPFAFAALITIAYKGSPEVVARLVLYCFLASTIGFVLLWWIGNALERRQAETKTKK